jgi:hypothetical protein
MQQTGPSLSSAWDLVLTSSVETKVVLAITAAFSLISWFIIGLKWWQFHRLKKQADRFFSELERTTRLTDAYHAVMKLPPSPYNRLFRESLNFYSELRPGGLKDEASRVTLTTTQVEALKMVLGKGGGRGAGLDGAVRLLAGHHRFREPTARSAGHRPGRHGRVHRHCVQGLR